MSLLEKSSEGFESISENDVKVDDYKKVEAAELGENFNYDKEFEELEQMAIEAKANKTLIQKLMSLEYELHFENKKYMVYLLGGFSAAAGLLSGVDQSIISGARIGMTPVLDLTPTQDSLVSSLMPLGAMLGSIMMTPLNEYFGRKMSIIISCLWYTVGAGLCAGSHTYSMMYAGRFLLGIGVGIEGGCVGIYISESVPARVRGNLVSLYQFNIALGEVLGYAISAIFYDVHGGWRFMLGSSLVFSTALMVGMFFLPESPRYLVHKNKIGEAYDVWKRLRDISLEENKLEFLDMRQAAYQEQEAKATESKARLWTDLFRIPRNRRALVYAVIMVGLGQLTGVNAVMYYMSTLMGKIGFDEKNSVFMSLVGGGSLLIGAIPAILWMDRFGRRVWGLNIVGFFIGLVLVGVGYTIPLETNKNAAMGVYLTGIILYMGFFGSYACLTWVLPSESFDLRTRSLGMTICSTFLYLWSFIVTYNFDGMQNAMTYPGLTLGFYGGIAFVGFFYQIFFMPETKDKTLEEIDDIFSKPTRVIVRENVVGMKKFWGIS
ncbi:DEHA2F20262p [Debaryomyces hansenii CBS767]|uniref:DEHA2F20262p n=1 Tax=Debaryomyces hansenii (strain ATCC 36239 / CBS 767 / BCRC 21394 / JCM 1990 / NBRC 0083 / IGC 2968) TaxID=284592 RepID=B5RUJ9_DEBHA|nr:DEHA2F20262p [Debaryomyces hansenii CBS767]CAR66377.1 DEHA2F20262p [Debaryomyces hansenii CBS767]|eukprot:XP_002770857.1 DEHA2F20262p [Debaryomyces hansenii CBS767]